MIDKLGTFEGLIAELNASRTIGPQHAERATMDYEKLKAEHPELFAQIHAEGVASVNVEAARTEATTAERTRVLGIIGHAEATGREALALKLAGMPTMSVEGASEIMGATPKAIASAPVLVTGPSAEFEAVMKKSNPAIGSDAAVGGEGGEVEALAERIKRLDEQGGVR
jgi:hypothetical protein